LLNPLIVQQNFLRKDLEIATSSLRQQSNHM